MNGKIIIDYFLQTLESGQKLDSALAQTDMWLERFTDEFSPEDLAEALDIINRIASLIRAARG